VVKFDFSHSKLRKQSFYAENFKIQGGQVPPALPSDDHGRENNKILKLETLFRSFGANIQTVIHVINCLLVRKG